MQPLRPQSATQLVLVLGLVLVACVHATAAGSACSFTVGGRLYDLCGLTRAEENYEKTYFSPVTGGRFDLLFNIGAATVVEDGPCTLQGKPWPENAALVQVDYGNGAALVKCRSVGDQNTVHAEKYEVDFPSQLSSADIAMAAVRAEEGHPVDVVKLDDDMYARLLSGSEDDTPTDSMLPKDGIVLVYTALDKKTRVQIQCDPHVPGIGPLSGSSQVVDSGSQLTLLLKNSSGCGKIVAA